MPQSMMDDFNAVTHIPMALVDLEGNVILGVGWEDACTGHFYGADMAVTRSLEPT